MVASSSAPAAKRAKRTGVSPSSNLPVPLERRTLLFCLALIAVVVVALSMQMLDRKPEEEPVGMVEEESADYEA